MVENNRAVAKIKEAFPAAFIDAVEFRGEVTITIAADAVVPVCEALKNQSGFNQLIDITAVDYLGSDPRFMVVYLLCSIGSKDRIRLKAGVTGADCSIATVSGLWAAADWLEREVYDLMGITFTGHPDLRRILMTDDWVGHPLRKDYPLQGPGREPYKGRLS